MADATVSKAVGEGTAARLRGRLSEGVRTLYPGYFALVMATGIISNTAYLLGHERLSHALLAINLVAFAWLTLALTLRTLRYPRALWADLVNPRLVFSLFTIVAAADVLGIQLLIRGQVAAALALWLYAFVVWAILAYLSFSVLTFLNAGGADVVHGGWLIAIVGTESLAILGALLAPALGEWKAPMFVAAHMLWGVGIVHYGIFITLFSYRLFFLRVEASDMTPLFWVVMGAAAISTNAGSTLIMSDTGIPFLIALRPFADGTTLILWAWATWWIPLLAVFGVWKYFVRGERLSYHPSFWSLVFPLGMYALATWRLSLATDFTPLQWVPRIMLWVAFAAWVLTMFGTLRSVARSLRSSA